MRKSNIPTLELIIDSWGDYRESRTRGEFIINLEEVIRITLKKFNTDELIIKVINDPEDNLLEAY